jgi:CheY-like chemotaxis protein
MSAPATILLAEDSEDDVFFCRRALEKAGLAHNLVHVFNGAECIKYLSGQDPFTDRAKFPFPNLLLLDLKMPIVSGFEVLEWIQNHPECKTLPVIILTGSGMEQDKDNAAKLGASEYHCKPIECDKLITIMKAINGRWLTA